MLWYNLALFLAAQVGVIYGAHRFFRKKKALYLQMIVCGLCCMLLGRLFQVIMVLNTGELNPGFHVGYLGHAGMFLFFFSANFGQMDSLVDDRSKKFRSVRLIALLAPLAVLLLYLPIVLSNATVGMKIGSALVTLVVAEASYFHFKHLIIPDVELGIIRSLREYNLIALLLGFLSVIELWLLTRGFSALLIAVGVLLGVGYLLIMPALERGEKRWRT